MNTLYIPIGISGSGKTTYGNKLDAVVVCPDDIRKETTGNISDQTNNTEVFKKYKDKLSKLAQENKDAYASMTHLKYNYIKNTISYYNSKTPFKVVFLLFEDSLDWKKCYERINNDIKNNVDRSVVPKDVVRSQSERYKVVRDLILKVKASNFNNVDSVEVIKIN